MKKEVKRDFINEFGNRIFISIKRQKNKVNLTIEGPQSISENIITEMEAKEILECLKEFYPQSKHFR